MYPQKQKKEFNPGPDWVATFYLIRNPEKTPGNEKGENGSEKPDFILVKELKKTSSGEKMLPKNFQIRGLDNAWNGAAGYLQEDGSLKITIKKTATKNFANKQQQSVNKSFSGVDAFLQQ